MPNTKFIYRLSAMVFAIAIIFTATSCSKNEEAEITTTTSSALSQGEKSSSSSSKSNKSEKTSSSSSKKSTTTTSKGSEYAYAYAGFNPNVANMSVPFNKLLLNRYNVLPDGYTPKLAEAVEGSGVNLDYRVAPYYQKMYDAAKLDGITLTPVSGYRTYTRQKNNFENRIALLQSQGYSKKEATIKVSEIILLPGTSEHNAGLAMDICSLSTSFENSKEFKWLEENASDYGFIMRYPKDKMNVTKITYEPWHYRYVGVEIAKEMKAKNQVLEEYLGVA